MSRKRKTKGKRTHVNPGLSQIHRRVKEMAAAGLVEDQIVLRVGGGIDKNQLRRRYIDSIKEGRVAAKEAQAAAEAEALSKQERERLEHIERSFASDWYDPQLGNLLYGGAHSVEEAIAWCEQFRRLRDDVT
jgi:hypothetical protein